MTEECGNQPDVDNSMRQGVLCPAVTSDYRIVRDARGGFKVVANRFIKKGKRIMKSSLEFPFSDVQDGDYMWMCDCSTETTISKNASTKTTPNEWKDEAILDKNTAAPTRIPITRDMLLRTHGVPYLVSESSEEVVIRQNLETPGMFINHSCEPTTIGDSDEEDIAARDIMPGEELTVDYSTCDWERPLEISQCLCGAPSCRGVVMGFEDLSEEDKDRIRPTLTPPVRAIEREALGTGPPVREWDPPIPRHKPATTSPPLASGVNVMRLVCPGPSSADAFVTIKKDEDGAWGLYAGKDVRKGKRVYDFWRQPWPLGEKTVIDMVFATAVGDYGDAPEGTVIRLDPSKCGAYRNASGLLMFDGWALLNKHSSDANVVFSNEEESENENWQTAYACKPIKKGDRLTMDWNMFTWDRSPDSNDENDARGFKYLSPQVQNQRNEMTWLRDGPSESSTDQEFGEALSPFVRAAWLHDAVPEASQEDMYDDVLTPATSFSDGATSSDDEA